MNKNKVKILIWKNIKIVVWAIILMLVSIYGGEILLEKKMEALYIEGDGPALIFDNTKFSPNLLILENDSLIIEENVYLVKYSVWNNGKLEIKKSDVRKPFKIVIPDGLTLLDYEITKNNEEGISNFTVSEQNNELLIDWDHFDPSFGFEIQLLYSSLSDNQIRIEGSFLGGEIKKVEHTLIEPNVNILNRLNFTILLITVSFFYSIWKLFDDKSDRLSYAFIIMVSISFFLHIYDGLFSGYSLPF